MYDKEDVQKIYLTYIFQIMEAFNYVTLTSVLLIGFGSGHIPLIIRDINPDTIIDAIDINPEVYQHAKKMGYTDDKNTNIIFEDGKQYIKNVTKKYDLIIIDIDSENVTNQFDFGQIKKILSNQGLLVINSISKSNVILSKYQM